MVAAVKATPLDAEFIDFQVAAPLLAVARVPQMATGGASRIPPPFTVIGQLEALTAAEFEGA